MKTIEQITRIMELEAEAIRKIDEARQALEKADRYAKEIKGIAGDRFVCGGIAYRFEHRAIGFIPGNRDYLVIDNSFRVIS